MQQSLKEGREERKVNGVWERERDRERKMLHSDRELRKERNNKP